MVGRRRAAQPIYAVSDFLEDIFPSSEPVERSTRDTEAKRLLAGNEAPLFFGRRREPTKRRVVLHVLQCTPMMAERAVRADITYCKYRHFRR
jgi:hypothetical protein